MNSEWISGVWLRIKALLRRRQLDRDLSDELQFHLAVREEKLRAQGVPAEEAHHVARRQFGNALQAKEVNREMWTFPFLETLWQDVRYGLRQLRRNPGFTAVAVITLALGIGANTAIFSVIDATLLRPLPFTDPGRLVELWQTLPKKGEYEDGVCYQNLVDWNRDNRTFEGMAAYRDLDVTLSGKGEPAVIPGAAVSSSVFHVLGVKPIVGRALIPADDVTGSSPVALVSEGLWRSRLGSDPKIIGKTIEVDQKPFTVVGVLPASFRFPYQGSPTEIWLPLIQDPEVGYMVMRRGPAFWQAIGRLRRGRTIKKAEEDLNLIAARLAAQFPQTNKGSGVRVVPLQAQLVGNVRSALIVLLGAVFLVLLIACVNVGNLFLARSTSRTKEIAVRAALGASRRRLIRQLLSESILFGLAGGAVGLLLAWPVTAALVRLAAADLPHIHPVSLNGWVLGFTAAISFGVGLIFGLVPAFLSTRPDLQKTLKEGGLISGDGKGRMQLRATLMASEVALAVVLSIGAGLLIRSFVRLTHVDLGFNPQHVLTAQISLPRPSFPNRREQALFYGRVLRSLCTLPAVSSAGATTVLPLTGLFGVGFAIPGRNAEYTAGYSAVSQDYFRAMQIPLVQGRSFGGKDDAKSPAVVIVNQAFARRYFPNQNPVGQYLMLNAIEGSHKREIVGVAGDIKQTELAAAPIPQVYVPYTQSPIPFWGGMSFVLRTRLAPEALSAAVRKQIHVLDHEMPVQHLQPMDAWLAASASQSRFSALLLAIFAGLALMLAAVGIYGVTAYAVGQRTHEIGVRMALGAQRRDVLKLVAAQGMPPAIVGLGIGIGGACGATRLLSSMLYAVKPIDVLTFIAVSLILTGGSLLACYIPARRATNIDPMAALRHE